MGAYSLNFLLKLMLYVIVGKTEMCAVLKCFHLKGFLNLFNTDLENPVGLQKLNNSIVTNNDKKHRRYVGT